MDDSKVFVLSNWKQGFANYGVGKAVKETRLVFGCVNFEIVLDSQVVTVKLTLEGLPGGAVVKTPLHGPNAGGPGSIPGQGTRSHMRAATKSSHATTKEPTYRN